jgi:hypothetical protein
MRSIKRRPKFIGVFEDKKRHHRPLLIGPNPRNRDPRVVHTLHNRITKLQDLVDNLEYETGKRQKGNAEFTFLADTLIGDSDALTPDETSLLSRILEFDIRHGLETNWWVIKLYFPVNRRHVFDSVRAIVETAIMERKEHISNTGQETGPDGINNTGQGTGDIAQVSLQIEAQNYKGDIAQAMDAAKKDKEAALSAQSQRHSGDLAKILNTLLALKPVESEDVKSHGDDDTPTVGKALTELVAVIDEYKKRLVMANARIQEQDTILAAMATADPKQTEI